VSTQVRIVDVEAPLPDWIDGAERYDRVWVVAMERGIPLGRVLIDNGRLPVSSPHLASEMVRQLAPILELRAAQESATESDRELRLKLDVVVCTRDRPRDLEACLRQLVLARSRIDSLEILVVDNEAASGLTPPVVARFPGVRYESEPRPGAACARNRGVRATSGDVVAFVDDDVVISDDWPRRILAPFADPRTMCVSGLVLPLELETESQELYEEYGALGRGYLPRVFDSAFFHGSRRNVVRTWELGGTANVAIRRSAFAETGLFDETLGPGLPTGVGEDIYMFYRLLKLGHRCRYEPAAWVWHRHRREMKELRRQLYRYSKGQTSYQLRTLVTDGDLRVFRQLFRELPIWHLRRIVRILRGRKRYPLSLVGCEILGNLVGPLAFARTIFMHRRLNGAGRNPI
jgi:O-antigen biosynthesis protein